MAEGIYEVAMGYRAALRAENDAALARLAASYARIHERLVVQLRALEADILEARAAGQVVSRDWLRRQRRYKELLRQVQEELGRYGIVLEDELQRLARAGIEAGQRDALGLVGARLPELPAAALRSVWNTLPTDVVEMLLGFLEEGSPLRERLARYGEESALRIGAALEESVALGTSPRTLAQVLRREAGMGLTDALRMARTTQINAYRESSRAAYVANRHIVPEWTWVSALDPAGTCMACVARHGSVHPVEERLDDHYNGWCVMVPNPVSYRELGLDVDGPPVDEVETGEAWFEGLSEAERRSFLPSGAARAAWQDGKLKVGDFLGSREDEVWGPMVQEMSLKGILGDEAAGYY